MNKYAYFFCLCINKYTQESERKWDSKEARKERDNKNRF